MTARPVRTLGLDLSLTSTGIAIAWWTAGDELSVNTNVITTAAEQSMLARIRYISDEIRTWTRGQPSLVVIEGPSHNSRGGMAHERAGLWWRVFDQLDCIDVPVAVMAPATLKKYVTGKGAGKGTDKLAMHGAAVRRIPKFDGGGDEADAAWLALAGADHLGAPSLVPERHRDALKAVQWPELVSDGAA